MNMYKVLPDLCALTFKWKHVKNGHSDRFAAKNISETDTLTVLDRFAAKTRQK